MRQEPLSLTLSFSYTCKCMLSKFNPIAIREKTDFLKCFPAHFYQIKEFKMCLISISNIPNINYVTSYTCSKYGKFLNRRS